MKAELKSAMLVGALLLTFAMFARAQITNEITFETSFPFYAGNAKMPAGSYRVTPVQESTRLLRIEDGRRTVAVRGSLFMSLSSACTTNLADVDHRECPKAVAE